MPRFVDAIEKHAQDRSSMSRVVAFCLWVCLSASAVARADISADKTQILTDVEKSARLRLLVKTGDSARLSGRYDEAATAYTLALDIQPDPVISGRLGLVLEKLGQLDHAGDELYKAVVHGQGQGVSTQERRDVGAAYDRAKAFTTWVNVDISHVGAKVTCDGIPWNPHGFASFWRFVMPGEHTCRARLDGLEDAVATFTAKPGDEITISLKLAPLKPSMLTDSAAEVAKNQNENRTFPPYLPTSNIVNDPNYDPREDPSYGEPKDLKPIKRKSGTRVSVTGGVVTVFGVASWNPAVGPVIGVSVKPKEFLLLGLEGRAAWLTTGVAERQINAMTAGGMVSACGKYKWFFGCALGHVGIMNVAFSERSYTGKSYTDARIGVGGRIGVQTHVSESIIVIGSIDALRLSSGSQVYVGSQLVAATPPLFVGGQISGGWEF